MDGNGVRVDKFIKSADQGGTGSGVSGADGIESDGTPGRYTAKYLKDHAGGSADGQLIESVRGRGIEKIAGGVSGQAGAAECRGDQATGYGGSGDIAALGNG